jgi:hypothetical protein
MGPRVPGQTKDFTGAAHRRKVKPVRKIGSVLNIARLADDGLTRPEANVTLQKANRQPWLALT